MKRLLILTILFLSFFIGSSVLATDGYYSYEDNSDYVGFFDSFEDYSTGIATSTTSFWEAYYSGSYMSGYVATPSHYLGLNEIKFNTSQGNSLYLETNSATSTLDVFTFYWSGEIGADNAFYWIIRDNDNDIATNMGFKIDNPTSKWSLDTALECGGDRYRGVYNPNQTYKVTIVMDTINHDSSVLIDGTVVVENCPYVDTGGDYMEDFSFYKTNFGLADTYMHVDNFQHNFTLRSNLPDGYNEITIESEIPLQFNDYNYCTIGETCRVWFNYNSDSVDHTIKIMHVASSTVIDSTTLIDGTFKQDYFTMDAKSSAQTLEYCILDEHPTDPALNDYFCGIYVVWQEETTVLQDFFDNYDCDNICAGIATSTFDVAGNIECGMKRLTCWAFVPSDSTITKIGVANGKLQSSFPMSIYHQIEDLFDWDDYSTTTIPVMPLLYVSPGGDAGNPSSIGNLIPTDFASSTGYTLYQKVRLILEYLIYFFGILYIIMRTITMTRKSDE